MKRREFKKRKVQQTDAATCAKVSNCSTFLFFLKPACSQMQNEDNATGEARCKQGRKTKYKAAWKPLFEFTNQVTELIRPTELVQNKLQHYRSFFFLPDFCIISIFACVPSSPVSVDLWIWFSCACGFLGFFCHHNFIPNCSCFLLSPFFLILVDNFILLTASTWCMYPSVSPGTTFSGRQMQRCHQRKHGTRY